MKFADLMKSNSWLSVEITLLKLYPDQKENISGYEEVFNKLLFMDPVIQDISIVISNQTDEFDNSEYVDVSGTNNNPKDNSDEFTHSLAIEFTPWNEWLGMDIDKDSLQHFTELEIIAHCLYEMTFVGYQEEEIQGKMNDIKKEMEDYHNMSEEEKRKSTTSLDDLLKDLDADEQ